MAECIVTGVAHKFYGLHTHKDNTVDATMTEWVLLELQAPKLCTQ